MLLFVLFVFFLSFFPSPALVCVLVHNARRGGFTPGGQAPDHFLFFFLALSCAAQSREALSPAICLPAPGIVIPKYRPVNISLVTATSPQQHAAEKKEEGKKAAGRYSSSSLLLCPFFRSPPLCFADSFSSSLSLLILPSLGRTMKKKENAPPSFLSCSTCYLLNRTQLLF